MTAAPAWLNTHLPELPWADRLPGTGPVAAGDWLRVSDSFAAQMAEKERLLHTNPDAVLARIEGADAAIAELLDHVLDAVRGIDGCRVQGRQVTRPDGVHVPIDPSLRTLARLCQEDFCLLQRQTDQDEYHLTAAALCFPASWRLADKLGRPLTTIHHPVAPYDANIARRVGRLFDGIQPGRMLQRANVLLYADPALHHPMAKRGQGPYVRCERQVMRRLPGCGAVAFSIHTYLVHRDDLGEDMRARLAAKLKDIAQ